MVQIMDYVIDSLRTIDGSWGQYQYGGKLN